MAQPTDIAGLYAWYRASTFSLADGAPCGNWTDGSGNGRTMIVATAGAALPKFYLNQIASYPAVLIGGPDLGYFAHSTFGWLASLANHTIFWVYRALDSVGWTGGILSSLGGNAAEGVRNVAGNARHQWTNTVPTTYIAQQAVADGVWYYGGGGQTDGSSVDISINGATKTTVATGGTRSAGVTTEGRIAQDGGAFCYGYLAEVFVFSSNLGASDFQSMLDYLRSKYFDAVPTQNERMRDVLSRRLWLLRRPQGILEVTVPLRMLDADILDRVAIEHQLGPDPSGTGWRGKKWQRRAWSIQRMDVNPGACTVRLQLLDRRPLDVLLWDTARTDLPALGLDTLRMSGVAQLMKGNAILFVRAQRAWVPNPGDASSVIEVASNAHAYGSAGEYLEEQRTNEITRSSFVDGTTGLTLSGTGTNGSAIATDSDERLFNPEVQAPSLKFTAGNPHAADLKAAFPATASIAGGTNVRLTIDHKTDSGEPLHYQLTRDTDGWYWNDATPAFQAGAVNNSLGTQSARNADARYHSKKIPIVAVTPITPNNVTGLQGWWKADAITGLNDGDTVTTWVDSSSNAFNLSIGGGTPIYKVNIVNGKPVVRYGGADYHQSAANIGATLLAAGAGTMFCVFKTSPSVPNSGIYFVVELGVAAKAGATTAAAGLAKSYNDDGAADQTAGKAISTGVWYNHTWLHTGGNVYGGINDTRTASLESTASGNTTNLANAELVVASGAGFFTGDIAELIIYNAALSESDRKGVEAYLANKYALPLPYLMTALTLAVLLPSGGTASRISHLYHTQIEKGSFATSRIVSQGGIAQSRDKSEHTIEITTTAKVYDPALGTFFCEFVPGWSSADLGSTEDRYIFWQETNGGADHDALYYDASAGAWVFERKVGVTTYTASKTASVTRAMAVKLAARWTGAEGELDLAAYTVSVFVDGVKGTDATSAAPTFTSPETFHRGHDGAKANHANGAIREVRVFPYALVDEEIAALP